MAACLRPVALLRSCFRPRRGRLAASSGVPVTPGSLVTGSFPEALGRTLGLEARAVCGGLKAGRGAQPQPQVKSCVLHLPAASSWLLTPLLSLHVPQEPAFEVAISKWALTFMEFLHQIEGPTYGCSLFSQPGWYGDGCQDSTDCWSLILAWHRRSLPKELFDLT